MSYRLRYLEHEFELAEGEFAVGRSAACQLSLDDPLVSRRHAVLIVAGGSVTLDDLGSRNGVLVNGHKISGRVRVSSGDKLLIGSQEMTLVQRVDATAGPPATANVTASRLAVTESRPLESFDDNSVTRALYPDVALEESSFIKRIDGFRVLGSVAEKALAMGRADEAERVLGSSLGAVLKASRRGRTIPAALAEQTTRFAAKLATATGKGSWVDYVIEVYARLERPVPAPVIDELYGAFRKVDAVDIARVKAYVEVLRGLLSSFGPAERFLFQRIEGLERLATLRS